MSSLDIHPIPPPPDLISYSERLVSSLTDQAILFLIILRVIIGKARPPNQPFYKNIFQLYEETKSRHATDDSFKFLAGLILHKTDPVSVQNLSLGFHGHPFPIGKMVSLMSQGLLRDLHLLLR